LRISLQEISLKTHTKVILAIPLVVIAYGAIDYTLRQHRIAKLEKKTYSDQLARYATFLKRGMTRADVERELNKRTIPYEQRYESPAFVDLVLLERFDSPYLYCSFEDASVMLEFSPEAIGSTTKLSENDRYTGNPNDQLRNTSVYRQLKDCL
jgi:hypothetical protein